MVSSYLLTSLRYFSVVLYQTQLINVCPYLYLVYHRILRMDILYYLIWEKSRIHACHSENEIKVIRRPKIQRANSKVKKVTLRTPTAQAKAFAPFPANREESLGLPHCRISCFTRLRRAISASFALCYLLFTLCYCAGGVVDVLNVILYVPL